MGGNSETECRKLVSDTKNEIEINVKTEQQIIDALDNGKECEVHFKNTEDEKTEVKRTEDEEKKAATEKEKAFTVEVVFGKHIFSSLTEGDCSVFFSSSSYLAAKKRYEEATSTHTKAVGAKKQAKEELIKVMEQAKKDTKKCHCDTKLKHAEANKRGHGPPTRVCARWQDLLLRPTMPYSDSSYPHCRCEWTDRLQRNSCSCTCSCTAPSRPMQKVEGGAQGQLGDCSCAQGQCWFRSQRRYPQRLWQENTHRSRKDTEQVPLDGRQCPSPLFGTCRRCLQHPGEGPC